MRLLLFVIIPFISIMYTSFITIEIEAKHCLDLHLEHFIRSVEL
jgi:hypothetical protein